MTNITPLDFDPNRRDPDRRLHLRGVPEDHGQRYQGVGNEFAAARLQTGMDIAQVATVLRIRKEHLSAIEEGRFNDLPAPAYALGFVRSYADYLGLDPAAAVEAFKQETSNSRRRTPLVFPTAEPVERMPRVWLLGVSAVLAAMVFGAWYYAERTGVSFVDRVPPVPPEGTPVTAVATNNLGVIDVRAANAVTAPAAQANDPGPAATAAAAPTLDPAIGRVLGVLPATPPAQTTPAAVPAPTPAPAQTAAATARATTPAPAAPPPAAVPAVAPQAAAAAPTIAARAPAPAPAPVETVVATPAAPAMTPELEAVATDMAPSPVPPAGEPVAVVEEFTPPPAATAAIVAAEPIVTAPAIVTPPAQVAVAVPPPLPTVAPIVPPAAPVDLAVANREGQVFGATSGRVVVLAHQDSWVQVTGAAGELLLTRILRAGDKYIAPAREDLVMMTGNAGALEVSVDGKVIPPLGPAGTVRRNVSLSPEKLLNGTAVQP